MIYLCISPLSPVLKCIEDYWRQTWLVANSVHTADKTRQDSVVLSGSVVWTKHSSMSNPLPESNLWRKFAMIGLYSLGASTTVTSLNMLHFHCDFVQIILGLITQILNQCFCLTFTIILFMSDQSVQQWDVLIDLLYVNSMLCVRVQFYIDIH